jgi:protein TonB
MKRPTSLAALAVALLLHAAGVALLTAGFEPHTHEISKPPELAVQLLQPEPPRPAPPQPKPAPPEPKPKPQPKPAPTPKPTPLPRPVAPEPPRPAAAPSAATPAPSSAAAPAPSAPARTGVMVSASYIAAETEKWYPRLSKTYDEQGTVLLRVYVSAAGRAEKVELRKRSDYPMLDEAAVGLAKSLKYIPAQLDGNPVADWIDLPVVFKLRS